MSDIARIGPGGRPRPRPLLRTFVGEVLRRHRLEQRRTLAEVAREACVSVQYLSEVERGLKEPSSEILAAVCDSLRIELSDLLAEVGRDLTMDRAPVFIRLGSSAPRQHRAAGPQQHGGGAVMLLAA
ncbi:helix-turn-helix domain-containing protein [Amorphoplanes digitatis]|uniref:DNA-binding XRE family transcriptional regulator n=1 Tax=Actinoplanes digitatis TaxID=1868 RepID=A0A7W7I0C4_9ACTN|nr:DNA-binding XRE family transcriptional regulator [Actinoplanes digitatis]